MEHIDISELKLIGQGQNGKVYLMGDDKVVKIFPKEKPFELIQREYDAVRGAYRQGVPSAGVYGIISWDEGYGIIFDYLHGETLTAYMEREPEKEDLYIEKYVETIKKLHGAKAEGDCYADNKELLKKGMEESSLSKEEKRKILKLIDAIPDRDTLLHGDLRTNNVLIENGKGTVDFLQGH